jgi:serine/threonine protein phosphatase PrpC
MTTTAVLAKTLSHIGHARDENQDTTRAFVPYDPLIGESHGCLLAIADGMGGYAKGAVASATAIETFFDAFYGDQPGARRHRPQDGLRRAVEQANLAVHQAGFRLNAGQMGTTLTVANIAGDRLHLAHVGDTRAYLVRDGQARCLTNDHSVVGELVRMRVISPDKVRTHQQRSVLNRSLGLNLFVQPDISHVALQAGDVIILCSDGLWAYVEDDEFAGLATRAPDADELSRRLIDLALQRQTDDNASVVVGRVERLGAPAPALQESSSPWRRLASVFDWLF